MYSRAPQSRLTNRGFLGTLFLFLFAKAAIAAGPWWTGPLLAPSGKTIPVGHFNFEPYGFYTVNPGNFRNMQAVPILTAGVANFLDVQTSLAFNYNRFKHQHSTEIGDYSLGMGVQLLRQEGKGWIPDLRMVIQETFPTGRFENLNPNKLGTDKTGSGAYVTTLGFNFQRLWDFENDHYLRTRLTFASSFPSNVTVHGVNAFGGTALTEGRVNPGNSYTLDLACEYSLTQHWVPVFEAVYSHSSPTSFNGSPGFTPGGVVASLGGQGSDQVSLAPALEYNFTESLGVIAGVWLSVTGPHSAKFVSGAVAVNYFF